MRRLIRQDGRPQAVAPRGFDTLSSTGEPPVHPAHDLSTPGSSPNAGTEPTEVAPAADRGRFWPLAKIAVFDIAGPLVGYSLLRSAGLSTVSALVLSGTFPAVGLALGMARDRRVDVVAVLVLLGIAVGTGLGLASGNARLVLLEGSVPTRSEEHTS